jgi:hypothetical protein
MINDLSEAITVDRDERWDKVLARFVAIETQLQELYWEVLDCMDQDAQPRSNQ